MDNLTAQFLTPTQIIFEAGASKKIGEVLKERGHRKVLIVTDKGLVSAGIVDKCRDYLDAGGVQSIVYDGIKANPTEDNVHEGRDIVLKENVDAVLAIGGGSPIDASKAISMLAVQGGSILDYEYGLKPINKRGPEIYIVPTTSGTGSEVTFWSVITDQKAHRKFDVGSPLMASAVSFVDPELTYGLPPEVTAATGMDALCHAIEVYTTKGASEITNALAIHAIKLISANLVKAFQNGNDAEARAKVMMGSTIAGMAFPNGGLGAVHGLTAPLGGYFDVPHGVANAVMLPVVMEFNKETVRQEYEEIAEAFGLEEKSAEAAIDFVNGMNAAMQMPFLGDYDNLDTSLIDQMATDALGRNSNCDSNRRQVMHEDAVAMYKTILTEVV